MAGAGAAEHRVPVGLGQVGESRIPAGRALVWKLPVCAEGLDTLYRVGLRLRLTRPTGLADSKK